MVRRRRNSGNEPPYRLVDGEEMHRDHPRTFFIPPRAERYALRPGQLAKLIFEIIEPSAGSPTAERMWVRVAGRRRRRYWGELDNQPKFIQALRAGDRVAFRPEHVVSIWSNRPDLELKVAVSRRSHEQDLRPRYMYRDEPISERDSGWQALVGDETDDELEDRHNILFQALGFVLDRWPELEPVFADRSRHAEWVWNAEAGRYSRVPETGQEQ